MRFTFQISYNSQSKNKFPILMLLWNIKNQRSGAARVIHERGKFIFFPNLGDRLLDCTFDLENVTYKFYICYSVKLVRAHVGTFWLSQKSSLISLSSDLSKVVPTKGALIPSRKSFLHVSTSNVELFCISNYFASN